MNNNGNKCQEIVMRYKNGEKDAINELPQYIDNMVYSLLKPYKLYNDRDEMYQVAWQCIMKCVDHYDPSYGTLFTTFAYPAIKRELRQYRNRMDKHNRYTTDGEQNIYKILSIDGYIQLRHHGHIRYTSLENYLESKEDVELSALVRELKEIIREGLKNVKNDKQRAIIADYLCGIKGTYIAYQYSVSPAYVSRVVKDFFRKIKDQVSE